MKKIIKLIFVLTLLFTLCTITGCNNTQTHTKKYLITIEYNTGDDSNEIVMEEGSILTIEEVINNPGYSLTGWYLDEALTIPLTEDYIVTSDVVVYAKWEVASYKIRFYVGDELYHENTVGYLDVVSLPENPQKEGYNFSHWSSIKNSISKYNLNIKVKNDTNLYAVFEAIPFTVTYNLGYDAFTSKNDLYVAYFTDFYNFMKEKTNANFSKFNIENVDDFLKFCLDWNANGKDSFYGVGDAFASYYVHKNTGSKLEDQPETSFVGYCYKNNKYEQFIPFLMQFFAYWRTDEGYTGGSDDPNNTGNDFFASPWASLVDTCKFFYFTSKNLNDTYPWFNSPRVKDALDNIPGVEKDFGKVQGTIDNPVVLKEPVRNGYTFLGWFDENDNKVTVGDHEMTVTAKWEKK